MKTCRVLSDNKRFEEDDAAMKHHTAYRKMHANGLTVFNIFIPHIYTIEHFNPFSANRFVTLRLKKPINQRAMLSNKAHQSQDGGGE